MGTVTHSEAGKNYLVFSVYQSVELDALNKVAHTGTKLLLNLHNIPFQEVEGCYKGTCERSFIVPNNGEILAVVKGLMIMNNQECYMKLDNHKHGLYKASFVDGWGKETFQGYLRSMDKETIDRLKLDYSFQRDNYKEGGVLKSKYWTIWPTDTTQLDPFTKEVEAYANAG